MDTDVELLEEQLDRMSARVQRNTTVVTPESLGQDYLFHVSKDIAVRKFVPNISLRAAPSENREVARVCVSTSLLGALIGHSGTEHAFHNDMPLEDGDGFRGGFKIYAFPFKAALKPNGRLVYDAMHSDEVWLVTYSKETKEFTPVSAGKAFFHQIVYTARTGKAPEAWVTMYVEITLDGGLAYSKNQYLDKGYWKIEGYAPQNSSMKYSDKDIKVTSVDKSEYNAIKGASAALLSHEGAKLLPASASW
jgi:hypothetical protein